MVLLHSTALRRLRDTEQPHSLAKPSLDQCRVAAHIQIP